MISLREREASAGADDVCAFGIAMALIGLADCKRNAS
jgi:hypothetical protein